jgi:CRISPR-associated endoribonuclease Cas6
MLAAFDIRLSPADDALLPHLCAHQVHAALLAAVNRVNPEQARALHSDAQVKPFAISTLWPRIRIRGTTLEVPKDTECRVRLTTLDRTTFDVFSSALMPMTASRASLVINGTDYVLHEAALTAPYGGVASWEDLCRHQLREVTLKFISPTSFRRAGLNVPLPDPRLVLGSLWQKWQAYSDTAFGEDVFEEVQALTALAAAEIHTRVWKYPRYLMTGFVGTATYQLTGNPSSGAIRLFNGLAHLAPFSGVGYKTTMGMGQCSLVRQQDGDDPDSNGAEGKS